MKIAMDARGINWYKGTGIGTYTENLLRNLLSMDNTDFFQIYWSGDGYEDFQASNSNILMSSKKHHSFFQQFYFPSNIDKNDVDLYHVPQNGIGMCYDMNCKKVVTIHDLIPYVMPETVGRGYLKNFLREMPRIIEAADGIMTVSEWSRRDILKFFPEAEGKTFVTPLAADRKYAPMDKGQCMELLKKAYNVNGPFILYIGGFSPRKNVRTLIESFLEAHDSLNQDYSLVIVGSTRDDGSRLMDLCKNSSLADKIMFPGFIPEEHLPVFYNGCDVFVYPSLYEGFGLPPLEAMSCGTPVITSNITSIPEVVSDAGFLINPNNSAELSNALVKVLNDDVTRIDLSRRGLKRAGDFSWKKTAASTLDAYACMFLEPGETKE